MSRQFWVETLSWATASGTAVANTTTETILFPNVTIPANYMQDGRSLLVWAFGQYGITATPTMVFSLRWGGVAGTLLNKTGAITTAAVTGTPPWEVETFMTTRSNGSSGTVMANGHGIMWNGAAPTVASTTGSPGISAMTNGGATTPAVATVDLTADTALSLTATWSASSSSNTITGLNYYIVSLN